MTGKWRCAVCAAGGHTVGYHSLDALIRNHLVKRHVRCSCGWVGMSHGQHVRHVTYPRGEDGRRVVTVHVNMGSVPIGVINWERHAIPPDPIPWDSPRRRPRITIRKPEG